MHLIMSKRRGGSLSQSILFDENSEDYGICVKRNDNNMVDGNIIKYGIRNDGQQSRFSQDEIFYRPMNCNICGFCIT